MCERRAVVFRYRQREFVYRANNRGDSSERLREKVVALMEEFHHSPSNFLAGKHQRHEEGNVPDALKKYRCGMRLAASALNDPQPRRLGGHSNPCHDGCKVVERHPEK